MSHSGMADIKLEERMSIDDISDEGKTVLQKGGSAGDERDMMRMGKKQELRVSLQRLIV